ncbi:unnamed protein product, partial [Amoebophrya sp. A120]
VRVAFSNTTQITLGWSTPHDNGGSRLISYKIERDSGFGWETLRIINASAGNSFVDYAVVPSNKTRLVSSGSEHHDHQFNPYEYRISAKAIANDFFGETSDVITAYAARLPNKVTHLAFPNYTRYSVDDSTGPNQNTRTSIAVEWRAAVDDDLDVTHYKVEIDDGLGGDFYLAQLTRKLYATVSGLQSAREYR